MHVGFAFYSLLKRTYPWDFLVSIGLVKVYPSELLIKTSKIQYIYFFFEFAEIFKFTVLTQGNSINTHSFVLCTGIGTVLSGIHTVLFCVFSVCVKFYSTWLQIRTVRKCSDCSEMSSKFEYLGEFEFIFETKLGHEAGDQWVVLTKNHW